MKPTFKPPGIKRLKLKCDELLASFAFKFNLHHYTTGDEFTAAPNIDHTCDKVRQDIGVGTGG
jgi:hypothetical protein